MMGLPDANSETAETCETCLFGSDSDSSDELSLFEELRRMDEKTAQRKVREARSTAMIDARIEEMTRNEAARDERDKLQSQYDVFLKQVESEHGGSDNCDPLLKVFCGYMRLNSEHEDGDKLRYIDLYHAAPAHTAP